ncbi:MAG: hypothetical protein WDO16_01295 [Bacteroidota bacterium]
MPKNAPDPVASVIVLETNETVTALPAPAIAASSDGTVRLPALDAEPVNLDLAIEGYATPALRFWKSTEGHIEWMADFKKAGTYEVKVLYAVRSDCEGSEVELSCNDQSLTAKVKGTEGSKKGLERFSIITVWEDNDYKTRSHNNKNADHQSCR